MLKNIKNWKQRSGKTICWLVELWEKDVGKYEDLLEVLAEFDYVVLNLSGSVQALQKAIGKPVFYHFFGVDTILFCPYPDPPDRSIYIYSMGRKSQITHEALLELSAKKGFFYLYDTFENMKSPCMEQHRSLSANLMKRSRYFIANASKMDSYSETKGQIEGGPRFVEGAAGGTIMIGEPPANDVFPLHFNWPDVVIPTTFDNSDIGELMADLDSDPERLEQARQNNIINSLKRHDWVYRWKEILGMVSMEPTNGLLKRERHLEELTSFVRSGGGKTEQSRNK